MRANTNARFKKSGFTIAEAIVAVAIMVIFFTGVLSYFGFQNKNLKRFDTEMRTNTLMDEAETFLKSAKYSDLPTGLYTLSFETDTASGSSSLGSFALNPTTQNPDERTIGKFVDGKGMNADPYAEGVDAYMRTVDINDVVFPFPSSKMKTATVSIWSSECWYFSEACSVRKLHIIEKNAY